MDFCLVLYLHVRQEVGLARELQLALGAGKLDIAVREQVLA